MQGGDIQESASRKKIVIKFTAVDGRSVCTGWIVSRGVYKFPLFFLQYPALYLVGDQVGKCCQVELRTSWLGHYLLPPGGAQLLMAGHYLLPPGGAQHLMAGHNLFSPGGSQHLMAGTLPPSSGWESAPHGWDTTSFLRVGVSTPWLGHYLLPPGGSQHLMAGALPPSSGWGSAHPDWTLPPSSGWDISYFPSIYVPCVSLQWRS